MAVPTWLASRDAAGSPSGATEWLDPEKWCGDADVDHPSSSGALVAMRSFRSPWCSRRSSHPSLPRRAALMRRASSSDAALLRPAFESRHPRPLSVWPAASVTLLGSVRRSPWQPRPPILRDASNQHLGARAPSGGQADRPGPSDLDPVPACTGVVGRGPIGASRGDPAELSFHRRRGRRGTRRLWRSRAAAVRSWDHLQGRWPEDEWPGPGPSHSPVLDDFKEDSLT